MRQLYTVDSNGTIPYAGGINGPLTTPTKLPLDAVITMVRKGMVVYQHNPANLAEKVLVTKDNVGKVAFKSNKAQGVARRALNRSIQEMEKKEKKEVVVDVVRKEEEKSHNNDNKKKEDKKNKNEAKEEKEPSVFENDFSKN